MNSQLQKIDNTIAQTADQIQSDVSGTYTKFFRDFQQYMYSNGVLVAATGFCIGMATKDVIASLLDHIVLPIFQFFWDLTIVSKIHNHLTENITHPFLSVMLSNVTSVSWALFVWFMMIICTFLILEYILNRRIIRLKTTIKDEEKKDFVKAKAEAQEKVPTVQDIKQMEKIELKAGQAIKKQEDKQMQQMATKSNMETFFQGLLA